MCIRDRFKDGEGAAELGLDGTEVYDLSSLDNAEASEVEVTATRADGTKVSFTAVVRIDPPKEKDYFRNGGILHYVLRQLARGAAAA